MKKIDIWPKLGKILKNEHFAIVWNLTQGRQPDLTIYPKRDQLYLVRWHLIPRNEYGNAYLHIQLTDDQDIAPHDHPWDNTSYIVAGGYNEWCYHWSDYDELYYTEQKLLPGQTRFREAEDLHLLKLLEDYSISLLWTGARRREWGFQFPDKWLVWTDVVNFDGEESVMKQERLL